MDAVGKRLSFSAPKGQAAASETVVNLSGKKDPTVISSGKGISTEGAS